jgi:hypothetical protein
MGPSYGNEWIILEYKKNNEWKTPWKKSCGKTAIEMGVLYG